MSTGTYEIASLRVVYLSQYSRSSVLVGMTIGTFRTALVLEIHSFCRAIYKKIYSKVFHEGEGEPTQRMVLKANSKMVLASSQLLGSEKRVYESGFDGVFCQRK